MFVAFRARCPSKSQPQPFITVFNAPVRAQMHPFSIPASTFAVHLSTRVKRTHHFLEEVSQRPRREETMTVLGGMAERRSCGGWGQGTVSLTKSLESLCVMSYLPVQLCLLRTGGWCFSRPRERARKRLLCERLGGDDL